MDAVEYFKIKDRICAAQDDYCEGCPLFSNVDCSAKEMENPEEAVKIVNEWNESHPRRTRQDVFLKMFPGAKRYTVENDGFVLSIIPCELVEGYKTEKWCEQHSCAACRKLFLGEEVDTAFEEIIYCGECKWRNDAGRCTYIAQIYPLVAPDHFCKYGKRK